jgi:hypothetical protein
VPAPLAGRREEMRIMRADAAPCGAPRPPRGRPASATAAHREAQPARRIAMALQGSNRSAKGTGEGFQAVVDEAHRRVDIPIGASSWMPGRPARTVVCLDRNHRRTTRSQSPCRIRRRTPDTRLTVMRGDMDYSRPAPSAAVSSTQNSPHLIPRSRKANNNVPLSRCSVLGAREFATTQWRSGCVRKPSTNSRS